MDVLSMPSNASNPRDPRRMKTSAGQAGQGRGTSKIGAANKIPIRHTLTSKLRMKKANPLLAAKDLLKDMDIPPKFIPDATPAERRLTFHPGMFQPQTCTVLKGSVSEKKLLPPKQTVTSVIRARKSVLAPVQQVPIPNKKNTSKSSLAPKTLKTASISSIPPKGALCNSIQKKGITSTQNKSKFAIKTQSAKMSHDQLQRNRLAEPSQYSERRETFNVSRNKLAQNAKSMETCVGVFKAAQPVSRYMHRSKSNSQINSNQKTPLKSILRSSSVNNIQQASHEGLVQRMITPQTSKMGSRNTKCVAFQSPIRKSVLSTSTGCTPQPSVLRRSLNDWLAKRGKTSYNFYHLSCFGLHSSSTEKEESPKSPALNETVTLESCDSTISLSDTPENTKNNKGEIESPLRMSTPEPTLMDIANENKENVNDNLAHPEALLELKKLVFSGYPRDQCEQWLSIISKSHPRIRDLPQYWECLAALEEVRGDLNSAVDCYGRAIMKGASTEKVEESLDQLWEKFSTLKIKESGQSVGHRIPVDTKQIFKSTIIKFALQQKAVKKYRQEVGFEVPGFSYVVTPVRRSTRKSSSQFKTTPTLKCVSYLNDLEDNVKDTMQFRANLLLDPNK